MPRVPDGEGTISPLISVLINNHNYGRFLAEAVDSALAQTYPHVEIVVVDDGSTDDSREILGGYGDRIRTVLKANGGQASAFNAGFEASRGEIITFLDSDDLIMPEKAARLAEVYSEDASIGWCFDRTRYFRDGEDPALAEVRPLPEGVTFGRWDVRKMIAGQGYAPYIPAPTTALSFRRELLAKILPMPVASHVRVSDNYLKFLAVGLSPGAIVADELSLQRLHGNNAYTQVSGRQERLAAQIGLTTGYHFLQRESVMRRMAIRMCARGIVSCWLHQGVDQEYWPTVAKIFWQLGWKERFWLAALASRELLVGLKSTSSVRSSKSDS